jgi:hypothetical protein
VNYLKENEMTYEYVVTTEGPHKGDIIEVSQSIKEPAFTKLTIDGVELDVKRVIAAAGAFILKGGTWARDGYERGIQSKMTKEDRAKLDKP